MWSTRTRHLIDFAISEDLSDAGDLSAALLGDTAEFQGEVVARQVGVIAGLALAPDICSAFSRRLASHLQFEHVDGVRDGSLVAAGQPVCRIRGQQAAVLTLERTLLNFLQRMSGVATLTRRYVDAARAGNPNVQVLDTRKTIPGWRELDKYAVRCGGGANHRYGLFDAVLLKDNHLAGVPDAQLAEHVRGLLARIEPQAAISFVEVEVDTLSQFEALCGVAGIDIILLDNFGSDDLRAAVGWRNARGEGGRPLLEASGGVTIDSIGGVAATGVDRISTGALTHSAAALDLGLDATKSA